MGKEGEMKEEKNGFIRVIHFNPAWDRTDPNSDKNYGISDVELLFTLFKGDKGVEFCLGTNWHLPHVFRRRMDYLKRSILMGKEDYLWNSEAKEFLEEVCLWDLNHEKEEYDDWHEFDLSKPELLTRLKEIWTDAPKVYYYWIPHFDKDDYNHSAQDEVWNIFLTQGEEALWKRLEEVYEEYFGTK